MRRSWLCSGMLVVGLGAGLVAGCDDGNGSGGELGAAEDNLKGRGKRPKPSTDSGALPVADAGSKPDEPVVDAGEPGDLPASCAVLLCPTNTRCVETPVQCIRAPCPAIASCEPIEPIEAGSPAVPTCAATLCKTGTVCEETPTGAVCVEPSSGPGCAATLCRVGTTCVETSTGAQCIEQKCTAKCSASQHCELHEVQCVKAPCLPQPTCVDNVDACATVRCKAGTHCELKQVQCFAAPCDPVAECVAN